MLRSKWVVLGLIWLSLFVAYLDRVNISLAGPTMLASLHLQPAALGIVLSAFSVGYALMQIPAGMLSDRFGPREVLIGALLVWSVFTGATGLAFSLGSLIALRVAMGLGEGMENGAQFKLLGGAFASRERSSSSGFFFTALAIAPACAAPLVLLVLDHWGWRAVFFAFALPGPIVAALVYALLPKTDRSALRPAPAAAWKGIVAGSRASILGVAYFGFNIAFWSMLGWLPSYLKNQRHLDHVDLAWAASLPYVAGLLGLLAVGWLGARFVHRRSQIVAASYALAGVGLFAAYAAPNPHTSVLGLCVAAFFLYGGFGPLWAVVLDAAAPELHGSVSGFVNFCGQLGAIIAPVTFGYILEITGSYAGGFGLMVVGLGIAIAALLVAGKTAPGSGEPNAYL